MIGIEGGDTLFTISLAFTSGGVGFHEMIYQNMAGKPWKEKY